jgi:hypothetical protein
MGDIQKSLIHTRVFCDVDPFDYLSALQQHANAIKATPVAWFP